MGLLALSVIREFPIGMLIFWKKPSGVRVPIDGRQRLSALIRFYRGEVAIPDLPSVPASYRLMKYRLLEGDEDLGYKELSEEDKERFEDYELSAVQYDSIPEKLAMEIFVMLQGGTSLTKTEIRAALGGALCSFVGNISGARSGHRHEFFRQLSSNLADRRKSHRNVCDILLHEFLFSGQDKHWTSLEQMYRDRADTFPARHQTAFSDSLTKFMRAASAPHNGGRRLQPQLRNPFFILDVYKAWRELHEQYDVPAGWSFSQAIAEFELQRQVHAEDVPWIIFTNELSNAGYAKNRLNSRNKILMTFLLQSCPDAQPRARDKKRSFSMAQKIAIWERAGHQCEWPDGCTEVFPDPRQADADHVVKWSQNGPTSLANGRLLCKTHNRGRR